MVNTNGNRQSSKNSKYTNIMNEYEIREIIENNELIRMCRSLVDTETVEMAVDEMVEALSQLSND